MQPWSSPRRRRRWRICGNGERRAESRRGVWGREDGRGFDRRQPETGLLVGSDLTSSPP